MVSQVRVYAGDTGLFDSPGKGREETVRLPLQRVLAPDGLIRVTRPEVEDYHCTLRNGNFGDEGTVFSANRFVKREDRVHSRSANDRQHVIDALQEGKGLLTDE